MSRITMDVSAASHFTIIKNAITKTIHSTIFHSTGATLTITLNLTPNLTQILTIIPPQPLRKVRRIILCNQLLRPLITACPHEQCCRTTTKLLQLLGFRSCCTLSHIPGVLVTTNLRNHFTLLCIVLVIIEINNQYVI